ncbi:hypothetical protein BX600DRAFT_475330 [Xylariales sp. PMI_506]|nr:hypothetical protein BX600DRAFT_475330 [Xylariales sp. PMI_506]
MEHQEPSATPHMRSVRQRAFTSKARTGCSICKASHVKCDEQKPSCKRCVRLLKRCTYAPTKRQPGVSQGHREIRPAANTYSQPPPAHGPVLISLSPKEAIYFDHFRHRVIHQLGSVGSGDFWVRTILRESMQDVCVLHCLLGLGALDYARKSDTSANTPSFKTSAHKQPLPRSYYYDALSYYTKSLSRFRKRIATSDATPRTLVISTILYSVFELLQGNTGSVDQLAAYSIRMLKDVILRASTSSQRNSLVAAPLDDDGVLDAEYLLVRMACFNSGYSPLYPKSRDALLSCHFSFLDALAPIDIGQSTEVFLVEWRRCLTRIVFWYIHNASILAQALSVQAMAQLAQEQSVLLSRIEDWEVAIRCRLDATNDHPQRLLLRQMLIMAKGTFYAILACLDATGSIWAVHADAISNILKLCESLFEEIDLELHDKDVIFEGILPVVAHIASECRERELRHKATLLWQRMVSGRASWELKGIFLGASAVIAAEEKARDVDGHIPMTSLFLWTDGTWNDDHTQFHATLRPKFSNKDGNAEDLQIPLDPKDYWRI